MVNKQSDLFYNILDFDKSETLGIYIHIPFCKYICNYCDFCKKNIKYFNTLEYIDLLISEMDHYKKENLTLFEKINTIYIGGGTPSAINKNELEKLFFYLKSTIKFENVSEFTVEANPDDVNKEFLDLLQKFDVTRISIGVQSINDEVLKKIGRGHNEYDVRNALNLLQVYPFEVNVDLMFNLPGQSSEDVDNSFEFIKEFENVIDHISYYSLILEEHTVLKNKGMEEAFSEEEEEEIYQKIGKKLNELGYLQYEISNFAKNSKFSKHNFSYWNRSNYLGFGLGASSLINNERFKTTESYFKYKDNILKKHYNDIFQNVSSVSKKEQLEENIFLALRTIVGIPKTLIEQANIVLNLKYFEEINNRIIIKKKYWFLSNTIIVDLLEQLDELDKG